MQTKKWKYVSIVLFIASILILSYSALSQNSMFNTYLSDTPANFEFTYSRNKNIEKFSYVSMTDTSTFDIDQIQDEMTGGIMIGNMIVCQGVEHDYPPIYAFSVCVEQRDNGAGEPTTPIFIGIINSKLTDEELYDTSNWEVTYSLSYGTLPSNTPVWLNFELQNPLEYDSGEKFYIIMASNDHNPADKFFTWGYSNNAPYPYCKTWTYSTMDQTHHDYETGWNNDDFSQVEIDSKESDAPEDIFSDIISYTSSVYEASTSNSWSPSVPSHLNTLKHIKEGELYQIYVVQDCKLFFHFPVQEGVWLQHNDWDTCFITWTDFPNEDTGEEAGTWNLDEGWNDVVFTQGNLNAVGSNAPEDVFESIYSYVDTVYESGTAYSWSPSVPSHLNTLEVIHPGITYHIFVSQDCTLSITTGGGGEPPEPEEPSISISLTAQVIQATGILSLIGGCISGVKHLLIIGVI